MIAVLEALKNMGVVVVDVVAVIEKGEGNNIVAKNALMVKSLVKVNVVDGKVLIEESVDDVL